MGPRGHQPYLTGAVSPRLCCAKPRAFSALKPDSGLHSVLKSGPAGPLLTSPVLSWGEWWDLIFPSPLNLPSLRAETYVLGTEPPRALSTVSRARGQMGAGDSKQAGRRQEADSWPAAWPLSLGPELMGTCPPLTPTYSPQGYKSLCHREAAAHCHQ